MHFFALNYFYVPFKLEILMPSIWHLLKISSFCFGKVTSKGWNGKRCDVLIFAYSWASESWPMLKCNINHIQMFLQASFHASMRAQGTCQWTISTGRVARWRRVQQPARIGVPGFLPAPSSPSGTMAAATSPPVLPRSRRVMVGSQLDLSTAQVWLYT